MAEIYCFLGILFIAVSWHFPGTITCAALSLFGCFLLTGYIYQLKSPYRTLYSAGTFLYAIGFYWLFFTIRDFGGFGNFTALSIFLFFIFVSALQFLIFAFVFKNLPTFFRRLNLSTALAWISSEVLAIKIFPWCLGHSQLAFTYFAQIADIAGATGISFLMLWFSESYWKIVRQKRLGLQGTIALLSLIAVLIYGAYRTQQFSNIEGTTQDVALIQANVSLDDKHNSKMFHINVEKYLELTKSVAGKNSLIIWPESVITDWIYAGLPSVQADTRKRLPNFENTSMLIGALTYESEERIFNSALGITTSGAILPAYNKQILMPFGEFTPFSSYLPWLKEINSTAAEFTPGDSVKIFNYPMQEGKTLKVAPLICYEDIVPSLAHDATLKGAEILVNITNDAWFGETVAPLQHNLIAAFRAIENRRYLLRATNTGFTAVINPLGRIEKSLAPYSDGILDTKVAALTVMAPSTYFNFEKIWLYLSSLIAMTALLNIKWSK